MSTKNSRLRARARARANIALSQYSGQADIALNLPAVPSISMTLDGLVTDTEVEFVEGLGADEITLDGRRATEKEAVRIVEMLERVRAAAKIPHHARVDTANKFPTAAGLASSASGFAALAAASTAAAGLEWDEKKLSALARWSSASAARSIFGGYAELPKGKLGRGALAAKQLEDESYWDLRIVVAKTAKGPKKIGSTEGMERSRTTSPYYEAWLEKAPKLNNTVRRALRAKDLPKLGAAMEQSTLAFHTCAITAVPAILYWQPPTIAVLRTIEALRDRGVGVWATMDAGPHVKALCHVDDVRKVRAALKKTEGVEETLVAKPGRGIEIKR